MSDDKHYIKLESAIYEVRVKDGQREVKSNGTWVSHDDFVDQLTAAGHWGQIAALCKAACLLKPEDARRIFSQMNA